MRFPGSFVFNGLSPSPLLAPSSWRDIHPADRFEAAGRRAVLEQLPALQALARAQAP